jgi:hypothetical protein
MVSLAPYISHQKRCLAEAPALAEIEVKLPHLVAGPGHTVRIPPELMPPEDQAMDYFEIFFRKRTPLRSCDKSILFLSAMAYRSAINLSAHAGGYVRLRWTNVG